MKRRNKLIISLLAVIGAVLLLVGYIKFFNGTFIYLSTGMKKEQLLKIDGTSTDMMEADILLSDAKVQYECVFGSDVWNQTMDNVNFDDYVKEKVKTKLIRVRCMNLMANKKGVALSREQKDNINKAVDEYFAKLTDEQKDKLNITKDKLQDMFTEFAVAQSLYEDMTSTVDVEISADDARVIRIQYICADDKDKIEEAYNRLKNGESFYAVSKDYGDATENECELKRGQMEEAFENAAFDLKSGETSDIVPAKDKYYIIKCTSDNEKPKTEANKAVLMDQKKLDCFNEKFKDFETSKYVELNTKAWNKKKTKEALVLSVNFEETFNSYLR